MLLRGLECFHLCCKSSAAAMLPGMGKNHVLILINGITLGLATSALQQIFRLHSCLAMLAMVTRSRQKICAASLPNPTLFLIFDISLLDSAQGDMYDKKIQSGLGQPN